MKRSPLSRKTPMNQGKPLARGKAMGRGEAPTRTTRINQVSSTRQAQRPQRDDARAKVLARDVVCQAKGIEGVPHGLWSGRQPLECHELAGGARRHETYLKPEWCIALCPQAHTWVTDHPDQAKRRGLVLPGWAGDLELVEAAVVRESWVAGHLVPPLWMADAEREQASLLIDAHAKQ